jgi:hypothetical protein
MGKIILPALLILIITLGCSHKPGLEAAKKEITALLEQERKAHFARDVDLFLSSFGDSMILVNKGMVKIPTREENKKRFGNYFRAVTFIKWDDIVPPVIKFSDDASLAYAIVQKKVILTYPDSLGKAFYDTSNYAWVSIYRKQKGEWKGEVNISTNK